MTTARLLVVTRCIAGHSDVAAVPRAPRRRGGELGNDDTRAFTAADLGCSAARSTACDAGGVGGLARFHGCGAWASGDDAGTVAHPGLHRCNGCWGPTCREIRHIHRPGSDLSDGYHAPAAFRRIVGPMAITGPLLAIGGRRGRAGRPRCLDSLHFGDRDFVLAFSEYGLYAVRDLAIFGYSLFFPLTCFAIRDRRDGVRLLRYLTYSGVVLALLLLFQLASGVDLGLFGEATRFILGRRVPEIGGEVAGFNVFSLAALLSYVTFERQLHRRHLLCALVCFFALAATPAGRGGRGGFGFGSDLPLRNAEISHPLRATRWVSCRSGCSVAIDTIDRPGR